LGLLKLYGKKGRVIADPRVITMLDDPKPPLANSDPAKTLLRLLRALDDAWRNDRSGPRLNGIMSSEPSGTFDQRGPSPEPMSKAPGHNQMTTASPRQRSHVQSQHEPTQLRPLGPKKDVWLTPPDILRGVKPCLWTNVFTSYILVLDSNTILKQYDCMNYYTCELANLINSLLFMFTEGYVVHKNLRVDIGA
jgi:hypothetical protein